MSEKPEFTDQTSSSIDPPVDVTVKTSVESTVDAAVQPIRVAPPRPSGSTAAATSAESDTWAQLVKVSHRYWIRLQPILQGQGSRLLRMTSQSLSHVADRLDQARVASGQSAAASTEPLPLEEPLTKIWKSVESSLPGIQSRLDDLRVRLQPLLLKLEQLWLPYLAKLKTRLPDALQNQFSDRMLTGILAGLLIFLLWTINGLFGSHPQAAVATAPPTAPMAPTTLAQRPVNSQPMAQVNPGRESLRSQMPSDAPIDPQASIATSVRRKTPVSTLGNIHPVNTGETSPVQNALVAASTPYGEDLILSVASDITRHHLTLKMSSAWYDLDPQAQDRLAQELQNSSQRFQFKQLEIKDSQNDLLARTPVVGDQIVIFRRHKVTLS